VLEERTFRVPRSKECGTRRVQVRRGFPRGEGKTRHERAGCFGALQPAHPSSEPGRCAAGDAVATDDLRVDEPALRLQRRVGYGPLCPLRPSV